MSSCIYQKICSIYLIRNLNTNKIYIGFTNKNPIRRWKDHIYEALNDSQCYIHRSMRKHGIENFTFEVIYQSLDDQNCLTEWENYFIVKYNSLSPNGYNMTLGGEGILGYKRNEEQRKKQSVAMSGKNNPHYGKPRPEATKKLISLKQKGIPKTEEAKKLTSERTKLAMENPEIRKKISDGKRGKSSWNKGISITEEARQKNRQAHIGRIPWNKGISITEEAKKKQSISMKESWKRKKAAKL